MQYPNLKEEKKLWRRGYKRVIGLDEAGRGPLAGPVVAAAVMISGKIGAYVKSLKGLNDSKKLTAKQREYFYNFLTNCSGIKWGIGIVSEKVIDRINILEATKLAMEKAVKNLNYKKRRFLILDGNFRINVQIPQKSIIKADEKVFSCAAASILAKVTRDRIMLKYHKKYPKYGFDKHKGYPTKLHIAEIKKHGPCKIHRRTFRPVSSINPVLKTRDR